MIGMLMILGLALVAVSLLANTAQNPKRQVVRIQLEQPPFRRREK